MKIPRAATVMLLRDAEGEPEVLLLRRASRSAFAPNAYVFPGGAVDPSDTLPALHARIDGDEARTSDALFRERRDPSLPSAVEHPDSVERTSIVAAAVRELFEEAGILMAYRRDPSALPVTTEQRKQWRAALRTESASFLEILEGNDLLVRGSALALFSHWVTPEGEARRFDTYFFMALAPPGQEALADARETLDARWVTARAALALHERGELYLVYPTVKHLERLSACTDNSSAMRFAQSKPIVTIQPTSSPDNGFVMPTHLENAW